MNANDIRLYQNIESRCKELKLILENNGPRFELGDSSPATHHGSFENVHDLSLFIYGYEAGLSRGRCEKKKN
jgi:hypothetical protein